MKVWTGGGRRRGSLLRGYVLASICLGVSACASAPAIEIVASPGAPAAAAAESFRILGGDDDPFDAQAVSALRDALLEQGWREAEDGATWTFEPVYTVRPEAVGAFVGQTEPGEGEPWLAEPRRPSWWRKDRNLYELAVTAVDPQTRTARYRVIATVRAPEQDVGSYLEPLAEAVASQLSGAAPPS